MVTINNKNKKKWLRQVPRFACYWLRPWPMLRSVQLHFYLHLFVCIFFSQTHLTVHWEKNSRLVYLPARQVAGTVMRSIILLDFNQMWGPEIINCLKWTFGFAFFSIQTSVVFIQVSIYHVYQHTINSWMW